MDLECNEEKYSTILVSGSQSQTIYKGRPILEQPFKLQDAQAQRLTSLGKVAQKEIRKKFSDLLNPPRTPPRFSVFYEQKIYPNFFC